MAERTKWTRMGLAGALSVAMLGGPQIASAGDRCYRDRYYSAPTYQSYYSSGDDRDYSRDYRGYGYQNGAYYNNGYNDNRYYNDGYYNNEYRDYSYRDNRYHNGEYYRAPRSAGKSAAIIGGGAAAGATFGAIAGGGKGAAIGAAIGGIGGLIYDSATRNRDRR